MTAPTTLHPTPSVVARALRVLITVYQAAARWPQPRVPLRSLVLGLCARSP